MFNSAINGIDNNNKKGGGEEEGEEYEEIEVPEWVLHGERGDAWRDYLVKHGIVIDLTDPHNNENSEYIWTLFQAFNREWDQQPHPKRMMRIKKRWTKEEQAALKEQIRKEKEEASKHNFGFK